ncbi:MAG: hypothetical protein R2939_13875 [Kofleriaceae bacterium]
MARSSQADRGVDVAQRPWTMAMLASATGAAAESGKSTTTLAKHRDGPDVIARLGELGAALEQRAGGARAELGIAGGVVGR